MGDRVGMGMLREVRPRSRPVPMTDSISRHCRGEDMIKNEVYDDGDEEESDIPDGSAAIELTKSEERHRRIMGKSGQEQEVDDDVEGYHCRTGSKYECRGLFYGYDNTEEDDQISYGNNSDCDSIDEAIDVSSLGATVNRMKSKLLLIFGVAVASIIYIFRDGEAVQEIEYEEKDALKKVPYSYKGYKDARIPDDDVAQYGGELFADLYGVGHSIENEDEQDKRSPNQQSISHEHSGVPRIDSLWRQLDGYAEMADPFDAQHELPLFWHVPKTGGNTLQDLLLTCYGMVGANEVGAKYLKSSLEIENLENGIRYVNVDLSSPAGIANAQEMGFGMSGMADVVATPWLHQAAALFDSDHKGRCFTLLRHPIQRAISSFYHLHDKDPIYSNMTIIEYAKSSHSEENWLVRFLNNEMSGVLDERHLDTAKEVLGSKCLVGLTEEFTHSFYMFDAYFGWSDTEFGGPLPLHDRGACASRILDNPENANPHPTFDEGDEVWNLLMKKNRYDTRLYEHAVHLFHDAQKILGAEE